MMVHVLELPTKASCEVLCCRKSKDWVAFVEVVDVVVVAAVVEGDFPPGAVFAGTHSDVVAYPDFHVVGCPRDSGMDLALGPFLSFTSNLLFLKILFIFIFTSKIILFRI